MKTYLRSGFTNLFQLNENHNLCPLIRGSLEGVVTMRTGQGLRLREPNSPEYSCAAWDLTYTGYERGKRFSY